MIMFINPYGADGILYMLKSMKANTFDYVSVSELEMPDIGSTYSAVIFLGILIAVICFMFHGLNSVSFNMTIGFSLLAVFAIRNVMFCVFVLAFNISDLTGLAMTIYDKIDWRKDVQNYLYFILGIADIIACILFFNAVSCNYGVTLDKAYDSFYNMYTYIDENSSQDTRIFTGFNSGAYFEYMGFDNLYIDARPELYTSEFTGDKNIIADYAAYCISGYDSRTGNIVSSYDFDEWFYSYDFDYVVVCNAFETYLHAYMDCNDDYVRVDDASNAKYSLYEKCEAM
jgi:hypothetical protein